MEKIQEILTINNKFNDIYNSNINIINSRSSDFVNSVRKKAFEKFKKLGIPVYKTEDYKYTNLLSKFSFDYKHALCPQNIEIELNEVFKCEVPELDTHLIIFINGWYYDKNSTHNNLPKGVLAGSFAKYSKEYPEIIKKHFSKYAKSDKDGLIALNTAFTQDGFFLYIPKGVVVEKPIQVINILLSDCDLMAFQRNLIIAEENSEVKIISCDHTLSPERFLTNSVTEIYSDKNSHIEYYNIQNEHNASAKINSTFVHQKNNSSVTTNTITLHGGLIRNNINVLLNGENCESNTYGIYLIDKNQHLDNFTFIDHAKPNCYSNELFKGVLDDFATGVFTGKILVRNGSQKTNAYQSNNNILLTDDAQMNSKPQLEIYADDVKCSHGTTVGRLDENALFYLRARGISEKEAKLLLMYAFAHEIIDKIKVEPLKNQINELVEKRFRGELSKCNNCVFNCSELKK